ncbi:MAG: hypothetical protein ACT4PN_08750 [Nitrospiraceae bacterium]
MNLSTPDDPYRERDQQIQSELAATRLAFINAEVANANVKEAEKNVAIHAENDFGKHYAGEMETLSQECDALEEKLRGPAERLAENKKQERNTKSYTRVADLKQVTGNEPVPFKEWTLKDQMNFPLAVGLMLVVLAAGSSNVYAAIMMRAEPVFIEHPILAVLLSFLLPCGSVSIHFLGDFLDTDRSRHRYTISLLSLTAASMLAWVYLFSKNFQIGAPTNIFDSLAQDSDPTAVWFTTSQLGSEMLAGSCLFLGAMHIYSRYAGDLITNNPEWDYLTLERRTHESEYDAVHNRRMAVVGRLMQLKSMRQAHIAEAVALFHAIRRRFEELSPVPQSSNRRRLMKLLNLLLLALLFLLSVESPASARDIAIGLSPYLEAAAAERQVKSVLIFLTETLEPGDSCFIFDGYRVQSLGAFVVPANPAYHHPKAKINYNKQVVNALLQFVSAARKPQGGSEPTVTGAIRMPQALEFIGANYPTTQDSDVILLGNPLYDDPKDKIFTMSKNRIPGDGHFTNTRSNTPYGIRGQATHLTKRRIHLAFQNEDWRQSDNHGYFVHRFWTLFIEGQGGQLSTFTSDLPTMFQRVKTKALVPKHDYKLEPTDKLEMILVRPPVVKQQTSIYERHLSSTPLDAGVVRQALNVEVGITWECGRCDLDLYGLLSPAHPALSYLNLETPDGKYFKDWTSSPRAMNGHETLAYHVPVDLNLLLLAVNFFHGSAPGGVKGEVRIYLNGQTYARAFHILAQEGNGGLGRQETITNRRARNAAWLVIDPLEVIGVRTAQAAPAIR